MSKKNKFFVHESSYVDDNVIIGSNVKIWHFSHIQSGACIGDNTSIGQNVNVANNVSVYEGVEIQDYVFCGPSMVFTNVLAPRSEFPQRGVNFYKKTIVRKSASIGANATIVCGNNIGKYAFVGAGSVITKDVPDFALVIGNPARITGWIDKKGSKLNFNESGFSLCGYFKIENNIVVEN